MVTICQMSKVNYSQYDEVWAIVRSLKYANPRMKHVPDLSPSWSLFKKYLQLREEGKWDEDAFRTIYVPQFLKEMRGKAQQDLLNQLFATDKHICLVCFCPDEALCHRSIIGGMLQGAGLEVKGLSADYSHYFEWWKNGVPGASNTDGASEPTKSIESVNPATTYLYNMDAEKLFNDNLLTLFFTGRRPKDLCKYDASKYKGFVSDLVKLLYEEFYVKRGVRRYVSGAAQGFDQLSFWAVEQMKRTYNLTDVQNVVFVAFEGQELRWAKTGCFSQDEYWKMIKAADRVVIVSGVNSIESLFTRNHAMCDNSDFGLGLYPDDSWRESKGGTAECLRYGVKSNAEMYRLGYTVYMTEGLRMCNMAAL